MDIGTVLSIVSIIISLVLSTAGVSLSIWFFKESTKQNKETTLMQIEINETVKKLEKLYDTIYTDTFGALRGQMDAMQKHIFSPSIGSTSEVEPNKLKLYVLGCISQKSIITIDELVLQIKDFDKPLIIDTIYNFHREGIIEFDGKIIKVKKMSPTSDISGEGVSADKS